MSHHHQGAPLARTPDHRVSNYSISADVWSNTLVTLITLPTHRHPPLTSTPGRSWSERSRSRISGEVTLMGCGGVEVVWALSVLKSTADDVAAGSGGWSRSELFYKIAVTKSAEQPCISFGNKRGSTGVVQLCIAHTRSRRIAMPVVI